MGNSAGYDVILFIEQSGWQAAPCKLLHDIALFVLFVLAKGNDVDDIIVV